MTARLERREEWADKARAASTAAYQASHRATDGIPFGQPVLVGHHSEGAHRRALARSDSAMSRACERSKMAERHDGAAVNLGHALDVTIFSDDDNAADAIRARITAREAERARIVALNKLIRRELKAGPLPPDFLARIGATDSERAAILSNARCWGSPVFGAYVTSNLSGRISADKKRLEAIEYQATRHAAAEAAPGGVSIQGEADYVAITFADKPARDVLDALKAAGFHWSGGSWCGYRAKIPAEVVTA
ncbi:MAG: DUF3560 domain-containing protein [Hyphomicrobiales bacterium]|nr:DUF3560 domain-containing protein [Hyphomicrobiales bacterium]